MESTKATILLVEDEPTLGYVIKDNLEENDYEVIYCQNGEIGWQQFMRSNIDLCLLDVMLPKIDGFTLGQQIRNKNPLVPIIYITAKSMDEDKIAGFKSGGDDYITKPFNMQELLLRIEVFIKRTKKQPSDAFLYNIGTAQFNFQQLALKIREEVYQLTQKEADLLKFLCDHPNQVIRREDVLLNVWGKDDYFLGRSMDVFMTKIRKYLKGLDKVDLITLHGVGFRFSIDE